MAQFSSTKSALKVPTALSLIFLASACSSVPVQAPSTVMAPKAVFSQDKLADAVKVPAGNKVKSEMVGSGLITYECRAKAAAAGQFEWVFVGPDAKLTDRDGKLVGKYFGPPATWEASDGSKVTGTQLAVSPAPAGNIPFQLLKANPAGAGSMQGISFIQRVATQGGVAPAAACDAGSVGQKSLVKFQADYIFWMPS